MGADCGENCVSFIGEHDCVENLLHVLPRQVEIGAQMLAEKRKLLSELAFV